MCTVQVLVCAPNMDFQARKGNTRQFVQNICLSGQQRARVFCFSVFCAPNHLGWALHRSQAHSFREQQVFEDGPFGIPSSEKQIGLEKAPWHEEKSLPNNVLLLISSQYICVTSLLCIVRHPAKPEDSVQVLRYTQGSGSPKRTDVHVLGPCFQPALLFSQLQEKQNLFIVVHALAAIRQGLPPWSCGWSSGFLALRVSWLEVKMCFWTVMLGECLIF